MCVGLAKWGSGGRASSTASSRRSIRKNARRQGGLDDPRHETVVRREITARGADPLNKERMDEMSYYAYAGDDAAAVWTARPCTRGRLVSAPLWAEALAQSPPRCLRTPSDKTFEGPALRRGSSRRSNGAHGRAADERAPGSHLGRVGALVVVQLASMLTFENFLATRCPQTSCFCPRACWVRARNSASVAYRPLN